MSELRIGVLGGTFDPVHVGHLVAASQARHACGLEVVRLEVAPNPWQKVGSRLLAPADLRFRAVEAAVRGVEGLEASRLEIERGGLTYTIDTLVQLRSFYPNAELFWIAGTDVAARMDEWREPDRIAEAAQLAVVGRPGFEMPVLDRRWRVHRVEMPALDISSTDLRRRMAAGEPVTFLVPEPALAVLVSDGHYAEGTERP